MTYPPPQPPQDPNRGLRIAGTTLIWVIAIVIGAPTILLILCCIGGVFTSAGEGLSS